jgi:creatinine amidohydrolase
MIRKCVIIPFGSYEWHHRLPPETDFWIADELAKRLRAELNCSLIPSSPIGCSVEHSMKKETITLSPNTFLQYVIDILKSAVNQGFTTIVIVNGHGGNSGLIDAASALVKSENPMIDLYILDIWEALERITIEYGMPVPLHHGGSVEASLLAYLTGKPLKLKRGSYRKKRAIHILRKVWTSEDIPLEEPIVDEGLAKDLTDLIIGGTVKELKG